MASSSRFLAGLRRFDPRLWPITVTVPLIVLVLMVAIGTLLSQHVLRRLEENQRAGLTALTNAYLDGLTAALLPSVLRGDTWEVFDVLDRARDRYEGVNSLGTVVIDGRGLVLAASDPRRFATDSILPAEWQAKFALGHGLSLDQSEARAFVSRPLVDQGRTIGAIYAELDIARLMAERREVLWTLVVTNAAITLLLAALGYMLVRRTMKPMALLAEHLGRARDGPLVPIPEASLGRSGGPSGRLLRRYNALVQAMNEREQLAQHLAQEERLASLGRLASGLAHEINNPLGGMRTLVDTLAKHGERPEVRRESLALLERGLAGIRDVVRSTLASYKTQASNGALAGPDLDDLRYLIQHEVARRRLQLAWDNRLPMTLALDGGAVRQAALNLLLNACAASPIGARVGFSAVLAADDNLVLRVSDQGAGLPSEMAQVLTARGRLMPVPGKGSGLGIWMVARLLRGLGGQTEVAAADGGGTVITLSIPLQQRGSLDHVA